MFFFCFSKACSTYQKHKRVCFVSKWQFGKLRLLIELDPARFSLELVKLKYVSPLLFFVVYQERTRGI